MNVTAINDYFRREKLTHLKQLGVVCTALSLRKVEDESHVRIALCDTNGFRRFRPREMSGATSTNIVQVQTQSEKGENDGGWTGDGWIGERE